jgi:hypothetical protein
MEDDELDVWLAEAVTASSQGHRIALANEYADTTTIA